MEQRMIIICFECNSLDGCKEDKLNGREWRCESCKVWERCWLDTLTKEDPKPKETSTFCLSCQIKRREAKK